MTVPCLNGKVFDAVFPKKGGRVVDELTQEMWEETGRLLARLHAISAQFSEVNRVTWRPKVASRFHLDTLIKKNVLPDTYKGRFVDLAEGFIERSDILFDDAHKQLIHGDCHFGNLIFRPDESLYLVDFDDCCFGPVIQDVWMLLPGTIEESRLEWSWFLSGYETFRPFPLEQINLVPALSLMRQLHFASWCAMQSEDPHFRHHFPNWGNTSYWHEISTDLVNYADNRDIIQ